MQCLLVKTSPADIASERLVKVTIVTTIFFAFITIPMLLGFFFKPNADEVSAFEYVSIVINALFIIKVPVIFLMVSWLSGGFRKTLKNIWKRLRRQSTSGQTEHQNFDLRTQTRSA
jgi:hypothetical protein